MAKFCTVAVTMSVLAVVIGRAFAGAEDNSSPTYRAAVVEFQPIPNKDNRRETMMKNARQIADYAKEAGRQGVDILVFPEYGITTFDVIDESNITRDGLLDVVQDIPDPKLVEWNPCLEPNKFPDKRTEVLPEISCAARNNSVAILVNLFSREACTSSEDPRCPQDGHYIFITNILFNRTGCLVYRYHKYHRFGEPLANTDAEPDYTVVDLGFAKFASIVCFDLFYKEPPVELVEKHGVRNIIYSTAWITELPFYTAPQFVAQFAHGVGANVLSSNMYYPEINRLGSGIYSSFNGALKESWDLATPGRMVVADVPVDPPVVPKEWTTCAGTQLSSEDVNAKPESCINPVLDSNNTVQSILTDVPSSKPMPNKTHNIWYESLSNYSTITLTRQEGSVVQCQGKFCCNATYDFGNRDEKDVYVLAVRNGCRFFGDYNIGIQVCAILYCKTPGDIESCGRVPESQPASRFNYLQIYGIFQTEHIYPNIFATTFANVPRDQYRFSKQYCQERDLLAPKAKALLATVSSLTDHPVLVASLYGRVYNWD